MSLRRSTASITFPVPFQLRAPSVRAQSPRVFSRSLRHLRAVVVTETYPPELNGAAMTVSRLTQALLERGHRVELVRPCQPHETLPADGAGLRQRVVPGLPIPFYRTLRFGAPRAGLLVRAWAQDPPDVVHIATEGPLGASALYAARQCGIPVSTSFHTNFHRYARHYGLAWLGGPVAWYLRYFHNRAACTFVPTRQARDELQAQGFRNLIVLGRGVDVTLFSPGRRDAELRRSWGVADEDPVILYVGRLAPEKNLPLAIETFEALRESHSRARFVLVGDGPNANELRRRHPEFILAGHRRGEDLAAHYASGDVFLFPSLTETFGNVTLEAMASGLAVVAFADAAAGEIVRHEEDGLLVPAGNARQFVREARRALLQPGLAARLRSHAARAATEHSWDAVGDAFEGILLGIVKDAARPR